MEVKTTKKIREFSEALWRPSSFVAPGRNHDFFVAGSLPSGRFGHRKSSKPLDQIRSSMHYLIPVFQW